MLPFSVKDRGRDAARAEQGTFDLIVIGGGITGAGVLRDASLRGLRTLVLEKDDFAAGTSSKSSKLIHGGLRYLKNFDFQMTRESCIERNLLVRQNPHLVEPMPFLFPIYEGDKEGPGLVRLGMWVYEALASFQNFERFKMVSRAKSLELAPDMRGEGLRGSAYYYDAWVDDARLVIETLKAGLRAGGVAFNRMKVVGFLKEAGRVVGVTAEDTLTGGRHTFRGRVVLNATGTWVEAIRGLDSGRKEGLLKPTKGVHLVLARDRVRQGPTLAFSSVQDRRMMFSIPWEKVLIVGTTDTHYDGDPDRVVTTAEDVDYILTAANHIFPAAKLTEADVLATYAGLRPLVASADTENPGEISREHQVFEDPSGLISIAGGKLTTYRLMARQLVDLVVGRLPPDMRHGVQACTTDQPISGVIIDVDEEIRRLVSEGLPQAVAHHLVTTYGPDAYEVRELARHVPGGFEPLVAGAGYIRAEVVWAVLHEGAASLSDVLTRRIRLAIWTAGQGLEAAVPASDLIARELGWDEAQRQAEVEAYKAWVTLHHRPVHGPAVSA